MTPPKVKPETPKLTAEEAINALISALGYEDTDIVALDIAAGRVRVVTDQRAFVSHKVDWKPAEKPKENDERA